MGHSDLQLVLLVCIWGMTPISAQALNKGGHWISKPGSFWVLEGTAATFNWTHSRSDPVTLLYKYKQPNSSQEILECRRENGSVIYMRGSYRDRIIIHDVEGSANITLEDVKPSDAGMYTVWVVDPDDIVDKATRTAFRTTADATLSVVRVSDVNITVQTGDDHEFVDARQFQNGTNVTLVPKYCNVSEEAITITVGERVPMPQSINFSNLHQDKSCDNTRSCSRTVSCSGTSYLIITVNFKVQNMEEIRIMKQYKMQGTDESQSHEEGPTKIVVGVLVGLGSLVVLLVAVIFIYRRCTRTKHYKIPDVTVVDMNQHKNNDFPVAEYMFKFMLSDLLPLHSCRGIDVLVGSLSALLNTSGGLITIEAGTSRSSGKLEPAMKKIRTFIEEKFKCISPEIFSECIRLQCNDAKVCYLIVKRSTSPVVYTQSSTRERTNRDLQDREAAEKVPLTENRRLYFVVNKSGDVEQQSDSEDADCSAGNNRELIQAEYQQNSLSGLKQIAKTKNAQIFSWTQTKIWQTDSTKSISTLEIPDSVCFEMFHLEEPLRCTPPLHVMKNIFNQISTQNQADTLSETLIKFCESLFGWSIGVPSFAKALGLEDILQTPLSLLADLLLLTRDGGLKIVSVHRQRPETPDRRYTLSAARILKMKLLQEPDFPNLHVGAAIIYPEEDGNLEDSEVSDALQEFYKFPLVEPEASEKSLQRGMANLLLKSHTYARNVLAENILRHSTTHEQASILQHLEDFKPAVLTGPPAAGKTWTALSKVEALSSEHRYVMKSNVRIHIAEKFQGYEHVRDEACCEVFHVNFDSLHRVLCSSEKDCVILDIEPSRSDMTIDDWTDFFSQLHSNQKEKHIFLCMDTDDLEDQSTQADVIKEAFRYHCQKNLMECDIKTMFVIQRTCSKIASFVKSRAERGKRAFLDKKFGKSNAPEGDDVTMHLLTAESTAADVAAYLKEIVTHLLSTSTERWAWFLYDESDIAVVIDDKFTKRRNYVAEISDVFSTGTPKHNIKLASSSSDGMIIDSAENFRCNKVPSTALIFVTIDDTGAAEQAFLDNPRYVTGITSRAVRRLDIVYVGRNGDRICKDLQFNDE